MFPETLHTKGYLLTALISEGSLDGCSVVDLWILSLSFLKMLVCVRVDQAGLKLRRSVSPVRGYGVHYQAWLCLCVLCQSLLYVVFKHQVLSFHLLDYLYLVLLLNDNLARYNALARQSILALRYFIPVTLLRSQLLILLSSYARESYFFLYAFKFVCLCLYFRDSVLLCIIWSVCFAYSFILWFY